MNTVIHLKTARVYAQGSDMMPKIERIVVKLEDGDNFKKFLSHIRLKGFVETEPPVVAKVMKREGVDKPWVKVDVTPWQDAVNAAVSMDAAPEAVDYKKLSEKQAEQISKQAKGMKSLEERLAALENPKTEPEEVIEELTPRQKLEAKAAELDVTFSHNIGDVKLLAKIQEKEPGFTL